MKLNFTLIILMSVLLSACGWEGGGLNLPEIIIVGIIQKKYLLKSGLI
ncbi:hypothetical protein EV697_1193 [Bisgaardia hudsonensis]|uniref:Lipoprotein n=1 Tax=Bisgaardia hudsonensis TaxID=109472 RepID=A0A4R2MVU6_9PAST|nr:hypothetical protein [Bisgaardia hudsonensis]TCP10708.1 hypothetical protein EV697_1193 [Bisgaardia hudsonensis]